MFQSQQRHGLMSRCWTTKEIDKQSPLAGVLVGQGGQDASAVKNGLHLFEIAMLGQQLLAGFLPKAAEVFVDERVIQWPSDRMGRESQKP